jgi:CheY-specific phosphatase CheX
VDLVKIEKDKDDYIFYSEDEAKYFLEILVDITQNMLKNEAQLDILQKEFYPNDIDKLELKDITSMISIDDKFRMNLIFTFDEKLLKYISKNYTAGMDFADEEYENVLGETAGDIINIVLGLSIGRFARTRRIFNLSTPVIVHKAARISRYKNTKLYGAEVISEYGNMSLFIVIPGEETKKRIMSVNIP